MRENNLKRILKMDSSISGSVLHVESAAKNLLRVCADIERFDKEGKFDLIIDRCEDIEEFAQKALKFGKRIENEAKSKK